MAFLAPWFLLGTLAIAGPVVAHLRRLHVQKRVAFSAVDLLEPRPPRSARRSWEDLTLLAARIGVLALLSLAFARPYLPLGGSGAGLTQNERRLVVLVDTSASMRRGKAMEEARREVLERARAGGPDSALEVRTFDRVSRTVLSFAQWSQTVQVDRETLLHKTLSTLEPGWAVARLDEALRAVAEHHASRDSGGFTEVLIVSDFQEGTGIAGLQGYEWPQRFSVTTCRVGHEKAPGATLRWLPPDLDAAPNEAPCRLQIVTPPEYRLDSVRLRTEGAAQTQNSFAVVAGKSKVVTLPHAAAFNRVRVDESDDIASAVWVARAPLKRALVAFAADSASGPVASEGEDKTVAAYFMRSALQALGETRVELVEAAALPVARDAEIALWVVCGGTLQALQERIGSSVEHGANALVLLGSAAEAGVLGALAGVPITAREHQGQDGSFAVLGAIEREHPLFAPFLSPNFSDFTAIRFWKHRVLELSANSAAHVLARFEGGDPAVVEIQRCRGRIVGWTSDWKPADGQWVLSSRCVPFLAACVERAGGGRRPLVTGTPGDGFVVPSGTTGVRGEGGELLPVSGGSVVPNRPGVYQIEPEGGVLVVNLAPEETTFATLPDGKLEALGVPFSRQAVASEGAEGGTGAAVSLALGELEARQGAWRFVLAAVLGLLVLETVWAARITQRRKAIA